MNAEPLTSEELVELHGASWMGASAACLRDGAVDAVMARLLATLDASNNEVRRLSAVIDALPPCGTCGGPATLTWGGMLRCDEHRDGRAPLRDLPYAAALRALAAKEPPR